MNRYNPTKSIRGMEYSDDGRYVLHSDAMAEIKEKDKRIADLTAERDRMREAAIMAHRVLLQMNDHEDYTIRTINDLAAAIAQDAIGKEGK